MRLNFYSLQLFVAVVEEGTIAAAAEREHIATSALSKRISELERIVGTPLLIRQARGVAPTAAGQILARGARKLLHDGEDLSMAVRDFATGMSGHVRIAANLSSLTQFLPADLKLFSLAHPKVQVDLEEGVSSVVTRLVLDNAADIGIYAKSDDEQLLETFDYRADSMVLVAPDSHPLAAESAVLFADTLMHDHIGMHRGSAGNYLLARAASAAGQSLKMRFQVTSYDAMISLIKAGMGIGMMPRDAIALYASQGLAIVGLKDDWAQRRLKLCVRNGPGLSTAAGMLLEHLRRTAET